MKRSSALAFAALVLSIFASPSASQIAGSIVINSQKFLAYPIHDPHPRAYPIDNARTYAGQARIDANS